MNLRPVASPSLILAAVIYLVLLGIALAASAAGPLGIALAWSIMSSFWRYCHAVLRWVAQGRRDVLPPGMDYLNPIAERGVALHFMVFASLALLATWGAGFYDGPVRPVLRWIVGPIAVAAFPASAALMGLTGHLPESLNPARIVAVVRAFGVQYAALLLGCAALVLLSLSIGGALLSGGIATLLLSGTIVIWGLLAVFALIGSTIREHRTELEIPGEVVAESDWRKRETQARWRETLDHSYASIRSGLVEQGYRTIRQLVSEERESNDVYEWVVARMLTWEDKTHALQVARRYIEKLIERGQEHGALDLFVQCRGVAPDFSVPGENAAVLAACARSIGRPRLAEDLSGTEAPD